MSKPKKETFHTQAGVFFFSTMPIFKELSKRSHHAAAAGFQWRMTWAVNSGGQPGGGVQISKFHPAF